MFPPGFVNEPGGHCAANWIAEVAWGEEAILAEIAATDALGEAAGVECLSEIWSWNDASARTKAEVLAAFDRAIAATSPPPPNPEFGHVRFEEKVAA